MSDVAEIDDHQRVYHLRRAGHSFYDIGMFVGVSTEQAVEYYRKYMSEVRRHLDIDEHQMHVALELARLDELQAALWDDAVINKDLKAADEILKIMSQRAKYLGLEKIAPTPDKISQILLVTGSQREFIEALRAGQAGDPSANHGELVAGELLDDEGEEDGEEDP
jgi:hypothetical protein